MQHELNPEHGQRRYRPDVLYASIHKIFGDDLLIARIKSCDSQNRYLYSNYELLRVSGYNYPLDPQNTGKEIRIHVAGINRLGEVIGTFHEV